MTTTQKNSWNKLTAKRRRKAQKVGNDNGWHTKS